MTLQVAVAPGEGTADRYQGLKLSYKSGPAFMGAAYEWNTDRVTGESTNKLFSASANCDLGRVRLFGGMQSARDLTNRAGNLTGVANWTITGPKSFAATRLQAYTLGVAVPIGVATVGANYTRTKYSSSTTGYDLGRLAFGGVYNLSKQTALYAGLSFATGDLKEYIAEKRMAEVGIRKWF